MSDVARDLLLKLLAQADRGGRATVPVNERSARDYFAVPDLAGRDAIHAALKNAEAAGAVRLEWGRGVEAQDLKRLRLSDADRLADWLGVPRARARAEVIDRALGPPLRDAPGWLRDAYAEALEQWRLGKPAFRTVAADGAGAVDLFRTARAVAAGEQESLDLRRFSVRVLGDSKAVERLLGRLGDLLRRNPEWAHLEDNGELFRVLGLEKFPPPLFIKGPLRIDYGGTWLDVAALTPYVGLSPDGIRGFEPSGPVPYLLTVENLASFQRHAREIEDAGVLIYTAGFPAPALIGALRRLDLCLPPDCPFFHWGDRDLGGLRIFEKLCASLSVHAFRPHLMTEALPDEPPFDEAERRQLRRHVERDGPAGGLARSWLDAGAGPMEQEMVDPMRPSGRGILH